MAFVGDMAMSYIEPSCYDTSAARNRTVQHQVDMVDELRRIVMLAAVVDLVTRTMAFGPYQVLVLYLFHRFYHLWMISVAVNVSNHRYVF